LEEGKSNNFQNWEDLLPASFLKKIQATHSWKDRLHIFKKILLGQQVNSLSFYEFLNLIKLEKT
jgi:hypothetical protein